MEIKIAIEYLSKSIEAIETLKSEKDEGAMEYQKWQECTESMVRNIFGESSAEYKELHELFHPLCFCMPSGGFNERIDYHRQYVNRLENAFSKLSGYKTVLMMRVASSNEDQSFSANNTIDGKLFLAVLAAECKVNYDKTMFQECAGTAARLKQGCPISKYYALVEYLDMQPEDTRLTSIDNVFLLRKCKRLPYEKRSVYEEVRAQHINNPISFDVMKLFVKEMQNFINATWYDPEAALARGAFV